MTTERVDLEGIHEAVRSRYAEAALAASTAANREAAGHQFRRVRRLLRRV